MIYVVLVVVVILAIAVAILFGTQVELFRDMRQVRELTGFLDTPLEVDLGAVQGLHPRSIGLPEWASGSPESALIVILSDSCATCRSLAASLSSAVPPHVQIVLSNPGRRESELAEVWDLGPNCLTDSDGAIASALGLDITPAGIEISHNKLVRAQSIPSVRQLHSLIDRTRPATSRTQRGLLEET